LEDTKSGPGGIFSTPRNSTLMPQTMRSSQRLVRYLKPAHALHRRDTDAGDAALGHHRGGRFCAHQSLAAAHGLRHQGRISSAWRKFRRGRFWCPPSTSPLWETFALLLILPDPRLIMKRELMWIPFSAGTPGRPA